jgi:hypothetical protein
VDARVAGELRVEGRGQDVALADEDGRAVHAGEDLDVGPGPAQLRGPLRTATTSMSPRLRTG